MPGQIPAGEIHHLRLTVTDVQRSREFCTRLLGFQGAVESPAPGDPGADEAFAVLFGGVVMIRGNVMMGLRPIAAADDRFDPDRVGLDHLSFSVATREDLEEAVRLFDSPAASITCTQEGDRHARYRCDPAAAQGPRAPG